MSEFEDFVASHTDNYFKRTRAIVAHNGARIVTYALFMRRPVVFCPALSVAWLKQAARERNTRFEIAPCFEEGARVGAGEPLMYITGPMVDLVDLETIYLQRLGAPCVAAYNAYHMCADLPHVGFLAMDARHCAGSEMADMMAYAASVGSAKAKREHDAVGFIGSANDATAHYFGQEHGLGTMPHALVGYAGSTLRAAELFHETFADAPLTVLVDYHGKEITDSLAVCARFPELAAEGRLSVRVDTHGGRFVEGLDTAESYAVLDRQVPEAVRTYRTETELRWLVGTGVSAAAIHHVRESLDRAGHDRVRIVASSGFNPAKCRLMAAARAPIDVIGTGSYLPESWSETYATADIVAYDGTPSVKVGREFLLRERR
ncbi:MAG: nicotinate phosphoribosyltransferase [Alphaproteobacteria bacterium]|jgi:nicotinate phosphoribosyltransferase|nr:nicotinate phosphoribosyltransferase [Alphaproteobacteria bacterium]MDP6517466.1 nicotinate phosphoribosyltransferase [Alphaproteobacteria bacterium]